MLRQSRSLLKQVQLLLINLCLICTEPGNLTRYFRISIRIACSWVTLYKTFLCLAGLQCHRGGWVLLRHPQSASCSLLISKQKPKTGSLASLLVFCWQLIGNSQMENVPLSLLVLLLMFSITQPTRFYDLFCNSHSVNGQLLSKHYWSLSKAIVHNGQFLPKTGHRCQFPAENVMNHSYITTGCHKWP